MSENRLLDPDEKALLDANIIDLCQLSGLPKASHLMLEANFSFCFHGDGISTKGTSCIEGKISAVGFSATKITLVIEGGLLCYLKFEIGTDTWALCCSDPTVELVGDLKISFPAGTVMQFDQVPEGAHFTEAEHERANSLADSHYQMVDGKARDVTWQDGCRWVVHNSPPKPFSGKQLVRIVQ